MNEMTPLNGAGADPSHAYTMFACADCAPAVMAMQFRHAKLICADATDAPSTRRAPVSTRSFFIVASRGLLGVMQGGGITNRHRTQRNPSFPASTSFRLLSTA